MSTLPPNDILSQGFSSFISCVYAGLPLGSVQREEMEKAFHAGATIALSTLLKVSELSEDDYISWFSSMMGELQAFARSLPDNGLGGLSDQILVTSPRKGQ